MTRALRQHSRVQLYLILRTILPVILYASFISASNASEKSIQDRCQKRIFSNTYYLVDNIYAQHTSAFLQNILKPDIYQKANFIGFEGLRDRVSTYYDFDDLELLHSNKELVHIIDTGLPQYHPGKQIISYINNEVKPAVINNYAVKNYKKTISPMDKHPLFGRIKRKERDSLIKSLNPVSSKSPETITESLVINSKERVHLVTLYGIPYGSVTLSQFTAINYGVPNTSLLLKLEKHSGLQDRLKKYEDEQLNLFLCSVNEHFHFQFPNIKPSERFGYVEYNKIASQNLPTRSLFREYGLVFTIGQIISLGLTGFLIIWFFLGRYTRSNNYRKISRLILKK